jgi:hypothetical protein
MNQRLGKRSCTALVKYPSKDIQTRAGTGEKAFEFECWTDALHLC